MVSMPWNDYSTFIVVFFGIVFFLAAIVVIFDYFFPNNKFSKAIEKVLEWMGENIKWI